MSIPALEILEHNIVLIGAFNPIIYHPQWMVRKGILPEGDASGAKIKINHQEVSEFELDNCKIQVLPERFTVRSKVEAFFKSERDLVLAVFSYLPETPIYKMGLNFHFHYRFENIDSFHNFGHKIVPKDPLWSGLLDKAGLSQLTLQGVRPDNYNGVVAITTGISNLIALNRYGVMIQINDHYDFDINVEKTTVDAQPLMEALSENWENSKKRASQLSEAIIKYGCDL